MSETPDEGMRAFLARVDDALRQLRAAPRPKRRRDHLRLIDGGQPDSTAARLPGARGPYISVP